MCVLLVSILLRENHIPYDSPTSSGIPPSLGHSPRTAKLRTLASSQKETPCPFAPPPSCSASQPPATTHPRPYPGHSAERGPRAGRTSVSGFLRRAECFPGPSVRPCGRAGQGFRPLQGPGLVPRVAGAHSVPRRCAHRHLGSLHAGTKSASAAPSITCAFQGGPGLSSPGTGLPDQRSVHTWSSGRL